MRKRKRYFKPLSQKEIGRQEAIQYRKLKKFLNEKKESDDEKEKTNNIEQEEKKNENGT